ncbi:MAG TPA: hypothetical protein VN911_10060 [Candidatus Acidoferrum sp.]|nr:hypothetical protein [Candidatus Acidoferrum sp.]
MNRLIAVTEAAGLGQRRAQQYLGLFCVLAIIYSIYLHGILSGTAEVNLGGWPLAKFCLISALPFAVLAFADKTWTSSDAAPVSLGAWAAVFGGFSMKYGSGCPITAAALFLPLVLAALLAHIVGALCNMAAFRS